MMFDSAVDCMACQRSGGPTPAKYGGLGRNELRPRPVISCNPLIIFTKVKWHGDCLVTGRVHNGPNDVFQTTCEGVLE